MQIPSSLILVGWPRGIAQQKEDRWQIQRTRLRSRGQRKRDLRIGENSPKLQHVLLLMWTTVFLRLPSSGRKDDQDSQPSFHSGSVHGEFWQNFWLDTRWVLIVVHAAIWKHLARLVSNCGLIQRSSVFLGVLLNYGISWEWVTRRIVIPGKLLPRSLLEKVGSPTKDNLPLTCESAINLHAIWFNHSFAKQELDWNIFQNMTLAITREERSPKSRLWRLWLQQPLQRWWGLQLRPGRWVWRSSPAQ